MVRPLPAISLPAVVSHPTLLRSEAERSLPTRGRSRRRWHISNQVPYPPSQSSLSSRCHPGGQVWQDFHIRVLPPPCVQLFSAHPGGVPSPPTSGGRRAGGFPHTTPRRARSCSSSPFSASVWLLFFFSFNGAMTLAQSRTRFVAPHSACEGSGGRLIGPAVFRHQGFAPTNGGSLCTL